MLRRSIAWFFILLTFLLSYQCTYFKANESQPQTLAEKMRSSKIEKRFILHAGNQLYELENIEIDENNLNGTLRTAVDSIFYNESRKERYTPLEKSIIHEVHIYLLNDATIPQEGKAQISFTDIREIQIINKDTGRNIAAIIGSAFVLFAFILIIAILTKSSCPYVYSFNGERMVFEGEIFGGALGKNVERIDYLPLPSIKSTDQEYRLQISNELKERQFTDMANLLVVSHPVGEQVLLDDRGIPRSIQNPVAPTEATSFQGKNLNDIIKERDKNAFAFNEPNHTIGGLTLKFDRPNDRNEANLILKTKNTLWFDYQVGELFKKFGGSFDEWMRKQSELEGAERIQRTIDRKIPLFIYVKKNGEWELVDYINTIGPMAYRDLVIPIDLIDNTSTTVEVKIETGFMFWEVDYAAMSFESTNNFQTTYLKPSTAIGTGNIDFTAALASPDDQYMGQLSTGDVAELIFKQPPVPQGYEQTVFLCTKGYYELIRDYEGEPDLTSLYPYKDPIWMAESSRIEYLINFESGTFLTAKIDSRE
ncbi:hypothetical protein [Ekhidna sp.]|uniref:hypothetical protein n=1 Tax=Ekhidna sp. TaxID=2608089 RepID=UPI00329995EA